MAEMNPLHHPRGIGLWKYNKRKGEVNDKRVKAFLKKHQGFYELKELRSLFPKCAIQRLVAKEQVFIIPCDLSRGTGAYKRNTLKDIFQDDLYPKSFACLGRTATVRFMQQTLKPPKDPQTQHILRSYLSRYLTQAELHAVLWKLGVRKYDSCQVKSSIQIDDTVRARKREA